MSVERFNAYSHIPLSDAPDSVNYALDAISNNLQRQEISPAFPTYNRAPERVYDGLTLYADGTNWDPGFGAGLYIYHSGTWRLLTPDPAVYGGISQIGGEVVSVTATPQKIPFTAQLPSQGVTGDLANNEFTIEEDGDYALTLTLNAAASNSILMTLEPYINGAPTGTDALLEIITQADGANFAASTIISASAGDVLSVYVSGSPSRTVTFDNANYYVSSTSVSGIFSGTGGTAQGSLSYVPTIAPATGYQLKNVYVDDTGPTPRLAFEYDDTTQGVNSVPYLIQSNPPPGQYFRVENLYVDDLGRLAFTFDDGT